jgi:DNA-binding CsgD family transcriptional regulator
LLVGRENEFGRIEELLGRVRSGCGAVAVLEGPAGIGKTALLAEAARRASSYGFSVLRAAGGELELQYAFGVVRQLFWPVVARGRGRGDLLEGAAGLAALPLGLSGVHADRVESRGDAASAGMHGLYWLTANLAERAPLLVAVDDAHWADEMSLRFVLYLARRVADMPVLVLVAARPAAGPGAGGLLARLGAVAGVGWVRPAPLSEPEVGRLIEQRGLRATAPRFVGACYHASGGNPFLVSELLAGLAAKAASGSADEAALVAGFTPQGIVRWVLARLAALGEDAGRLASAFAVLGPGARLADAAVLAGLEPPAAAPAADALIEAHLVVAEGGYGFVHPLVQAAVDEGLGPARRAAAHARAARLAAGRGAPLARVAAHLLAADPGLDGWAVGVLRDEAAASGAPGSAANHLERALVETQPRPVRAELLLALGEAQLQAGLAGASQRMRQALELSADPRRRAEICRALGRALFCAGDWPGAAEVFRCGLGELPDEDDDLSLELRGWHITMGGHTSAAPGGNAAPPAAAAERLRVLAGDDAPARTRMERLQLVHLVHESARSGARPHHEVARLARRAVADGALLQDSAKDPGPYAAACYGLLYAGQPDAAIAQLTQAIDLSQRHGSPIAFGVFSLARGTARYMRGELLEALADLEGASNSYGEGYEQGLPETLAFLALCLIERDDLAGAARALVLPGDQERCRAQASFRSYLYALGRLKATRGQLREGLDTLLECGHAARAWNFLNPAVNLLWRSEAALLVARLGEKDRAAELAAEDLRLAQAFGAPHALGVALRATALIEGGTRGLEQLTEAVAVLDGSGINLELARTLTEHGAALRRAGYRSDARQPLRRALDLATRCGGLGLATRARDELVTAGSRPRREHVSGAESLTASELRVAQLAAQGLTNRQIAQALFVSMKTVSTHLGHVYAKLDVTDRARLAAALPENRTQAA